MEKKKKTHEESGFPRRKSERADQKTDVNSSRSGKDQDRSSHVRKRYQTGKFHSGMTGWPPGFRLVGPSGGKKKSHRLTVLLGTVRSLVKKRKRGCGERPGGLSFRGSIN